MKYIGMPEDGVSRLHERNGTVAFQQKLVIPLPDHHGATGSGATQFVLRHVVLKRAQQHPRHCVGYWQ
jgi:hypothetical protein